ncbi:hypothetical protein N7493_004849 [Penicillium malachiteum]|uniref:Uncharacterized protein n=1 Tax=Penicillium malachiteum TaxID=1324776 RepID=A0AAD6MXF3_9EURO|nr:hypothetical protein N7493_004849 [Penicillium malachiteum]
MGFMGGPKKKNSSKQDADDGYMALYNMCLVSKRFRDIAQSLLCFEFVDDGILGNVQDTVRFARTLYTHPYLGQFVHNITIEGPLMFDQPENDEEEIAEIAPSDIELFTKAIKDLNLGDKEDEWISNMRLGDLSVMAALVINKTPNVCRLILPGGLFSMDAFSELFLRNSSLLGKLEAIFLVGKDEHSGYDIASYYKLLSLPSLKLSILEYGDLQSTTFPSEWESGTLNIEELVFRGCGACKKLRAFSFDNFDDKLGQREPDTYGGSQFNAANAREALMTHKDTLEYLHLGFIREPSDPWIGSDSFLVVSKLDLYAISRLFKSSTFIKRSFQSTLNFLLRSGDCRRGLYPDFVNFRMLSVDITQPIQLPGQIIPQGKTPQQAHQTLVDLFKGTKVDFLLGPYAKTGRGAFMDDDDDDEDDYDFDDDDLAYDSEGYEMEDPFMDAMRAARAGGGGAGAGAGAGRGRGRGNGPMPVEFLEFFMQRAMQDPAFAHLNLSAPGSRRGR